MFGKGNQEKGKKTLIIALFFLAGIFIFSSFFGPKPKETKEITYSKFIQALKKKEIKTAKIDGYRISGKFKNGKEYFAIKEVYDTFDAEFYAKYSEVDFEIVERKDYSWMMTFIWIGLVLFLFIFISKRIAGAAGKQMEFGKISVDVAQEKDKKTFADVAGIDEAKAELEEVVDFLKNPKKYTEMGAKIPKGILLNGLSGVGKTLLARAVAGEAGVPFFAISGSGFVQMFVGVGASRVRDLFDKAKKNSPCIVFIDEIDAVGRSRGTGLGGGNDEREQTLNEIFVEMDGFEQNLGIIVIAATNRMDILDPALLRPGRFDRKVEVSMPNLDGREAILEIHFKNKKFDKSLSFRELAARTCGFSGADLENLANESAICATRKEKEIITIKEVDDALKKVCLGAERRIKLSKKEKEKTAVHESGHVIVGKNCPTVDPVSHVSIVPRTKSLGVTATQPKDDKYSASKKELEGNILFLFGGRAAEEVIFGKEDIFTGAANDIERATEIIRQMISKLGMDEKFGLVCFDESNGGPNLGQKLALGGGISALTQYDIDKRIIELSNKYYGIAKEMIEENLEDVKKLVDALLEKESLDRGEIDEVLGIDSKE